MFTLYPINVPTRDSSKQQWPACRCSMAACLPPLAPHLHYPDSKPALPLLYRQPGHQNGEETEGRLVKGVVPYRRWPPQPSSKRAGRRHRCTSCGPCTSSCGCARGAACLANGIAGAPALATLGPGISGPEDGGSEGSDQPINRRRSRGTGGRWRQRKRPIVMLR